MSAYSGITNDMPALSGLRAPVVRKPESELEQAAGQFEALFTRMMLKTMRESSLNSGLFESNQSNQYIEMFDDQVAMQMSRGRGLGLKQMLLRQLEGAADSPVSRAETLTASGQYDWQPANRQEFVSDLLPFAQQVEKELGVSHTVVLAQAALESGWGRHVIRKPDGSNSFNVFGIKADASWGGDRVATKTIEFHDGIGQRTTENFRAYGSLGEAARDYADFIRNNPRYAEAIEAGADDPHAYARELQRAGYATDPAYAEKIHQILDGQSLRLASMSANTRLAGDPEGVLK